ncbi:MAG: TIGR02594 family protein, partial [Betaproteobacteria bacterium]
EPLWLIEARKYIGVSEIPGPQTASVISSWLHKLKAWWNSDETPWCGVFVAACIDSVGGYLPQNWMRAKAWEEAGTRLPEPIPGCIVVFERKGGGHVGFVVGKRASDNALMVLGGNQGNKVSIAPFSRERVVAYVWPKNFPIPAFAQLAGISAAGMALSSNEA